LQGFISSYARDEILDGLERIEKDIENGKFQWINNKDIRTNIMEALVDIVEGPAKRLDAVISHYDQMLTVLNLWCNDSIDKFVTQIKELQVYSCS
jgi:argininosuccinate lyase